MPKPRAELKQSPGYFICPGCKGKIRTVLEIQKLSGTVQLVGWRSIARDHESNCEWAS